MNDHLQEEEDVLIATAHQVRALVHGITAACKYTEEQAERSVLCRQARQLLDFCQEDDLLELVVLEGGIDAVVPLLTLADHVYSSLSEVSKYSCSILASLALKSDFRQHIITPQAVTGLLQLLSLHTVDTAPGVARRAAEVLTALLDNNAPLQELVLHAGGIDALVQLLGCSDPKAQRAAGVALRAVSAKNDTNKRYMVSCGALPLLVEMLQHQEPFVHGTALQLLGDLIHSSKDIRQEALKVGAMGPLIELLDEGSPDTQRAAGLLVGQFAAPPLEEGSLSLGLGPKISVETDAVPLLIKMLSSEDTGVQEMGAFALARLAQLPVYQAAILLHDGLRPLLQLLNSNASSVQYNAAFALYELTDSKDHVLIIHQAGGLQHLYVCSQRLKKGHTKSCIDRTILRIEQHKAAISSRQTGNQKQQQQQQFVPSAAAGDPDLSPLAVPAGRTMDAVFSSIQEGLLKGAWPHTDLAPTDPQPESPIRRLPSIDKEVSAVAAAAAAAAADAVWLDQSSSISFMPCPVHRMANGFQLESNRSSDGSRTSIAQQQQFQHPQQQQQQVLLPSAAALVELHQCATSVELWMTEVKQAQMELSNPVLQVCLLRLLNSIVEPIQQQRLAASRLAEYREVTGRWSNSSTSPTAYQHHHHQQQGFSQQGFSQQQPSSPTEAAAAAGVPVGADLAVLAAQAAASGQVVVCMLKVLQQDMSQQLRQPTVAAAGPGFWHQVSMYGLLLQLYGSCTRWHYITQQLLQETNKLTGAAGADEGGRQQPSNGDGAWGLPISGSAATVLAMAAALLCSTQPLFQSGMLGTVLFGAVGALLLWHSSAASNEQGPSAAGAAAMPDLADVQQQLQAATMSMFPLLGQEQAQQEQKQKLDMAQAEQQQHRMHQQQQYQAQEMLRQTLQEQQQQQLVAQDCWSDSRDQEPKSNKQQQQQQRSVSFKLDTAPPDQDQQQPGEQVGSADLQASAVAAAAAAGSDAAAAAAAVAEKPRRVVSKLTELVLKEEARQKEEQQQREQEQQRLSHAGSCASSGTSSKSSRSRRSRSDASCYIEELPKRMPWSPLVSVQGRFANPPTRFVTAWEVVEPDPAAANAASPKAAAKRGSSGTKSAGSSPRVAALGAAKAAKPSARKSAPGGPTGSKSAPSSPTAAASSAVPVEPPAWLVPKAASGRSTGSKAAGETSKTSSSSSSAAAAVAVAAKPSSSSKLNVVPQVAAKAAAEAKPPSSLKAAADAPKASTTTTAAAGRGSAAAATKAADPAPKAAAEALVNGKEPAAAVKASTAAAAARAKSSPPEAAAGQPTRSKAAVESLETVPGAAGAAAAKPWSPNAATEAPPSLKAAGVCTREAATAAAAEARLLTPKVATVASLKAAAGEADEAPNTAAGSPVSTAAAGGLTATKGAALCVATFKSLATSPKAAAAAGPSTPSAAAQSSATAQSGVASPSIAAAPAATPVSSIPQWSKPLPRVAVAAPQAGVDESAAAKPATPHAAAAGVSWVSLTNRAADKQKQQQGVPSVTAVASRSSLAVSHERMPAHEPQPAATESAAPSANYRAPEAAFSASSTTTAKPRVFDAGSAAAAASQEWQQPRPAESTKLRLAAVAPVSIRAEAWTGTRQPAAALAAGRAEAAAAAAADHAQTAAEVVSQSQTAASSRVDSPKHVLAWSLPESSAATADVWPDYDLDAMVAAVEAKAAQRVAAAGSCS